MKRDENRKKKLGESVKKKELSGKRNIENGKRREKNEIKNWKLC